MPVRDRLSSAVMAKPALLQLSATGWAVAAYSTVGPRSISLDGILPAGYGQSQSGCKRYRIAPACLRVNSETGVGSARNAIAAMQLVAVRRLEQSGPEEEQNQSL